MMLMGHDIGLAASYAKPKSEELLEEYLKSADNLTIYNTTDEMSRNQQALATEVQAKAQRIESLKDEIKSMREDMKNIFEVLRIAKQNAGVLVRTKPYWTKTGISLSQIG
jgi:uncharacterized protein YoxC